MRSKTLPILALLVSLSGCTLAPKYTRPEAPVPPSWPVGPAYEETMSAPGVPAADDLKWQDFFTDERLRKVIGMALKNNRDLRIASLNVERARAFYGIQRAELLPTFDMVGSGGKQRVSSDLAGSGEQRTHEQYSVDLGIISWEIDFFGRIRSLKDEALEEYLGTEQARRSAQILLVSAVANAYLNLAADRETLKLAQSTLETQQASYDMISRRYELGLSSKLDLRQAQTRVDAARVDVALYTRLAAQDENALNLLTGSPVPSELLSRDLYSVASPKEISHSMSSEVLLRRPDILAAEHRLRGANANIGAARAAFFPRISLTTLLGTASNELSGLFESGSGTWSYAGRVIMPIFDARTWSALDASKAEREIILTQYEKAIQVAFREVADALAARGTVEKQLTAQQSLVSAFTDTYGLSMIRYTKGVDNYLSVLDAQRSLYAAQQGLIAIRLAQLASLVTLYKVLGGGGG